MYSATVASSSTTATRPQRAERNGWRSAFAPRCSSGPGTARLWTGISTLKVAPRPGALSRWRWPPYSWTMPCTMDRPMPLPWPLALVEKNGSKICSRSAGSMPGPLSLTVSAT
ncbi:hypothetical protein D9M72_566100 [compost metagenome]